MSATRSSLLFSFIEKYALLLLGIAGGMIISRLLTPAEIGVYSVGAVLLGIAQVLRDFGVGQYLVQERELNEEKLRAVLATSFLCAWSLAALIAGLGEALGQFYREPRLASVLQLLAVNFLLIPLTSVTLPMLRRQMRFRAICAINLTHGLCHFGVSVTLAWHGFGYMSLAWSSVAATVAALLVSVLVRPAQLPWLPARKGMGKVFAFGAYATGGTLIDEAGVAAPDLIIGKMIGMEGVGMFSKALGALAVFNQSITSAVSPVIFPLFSAHAREAQGANLAYLKTVSYITAFAWPFFAFLALLALPIVRLLYGDQWDAAAPLISIMCFSSAIYSMFSMTRYLFVAIGHVKMQARLDALAVPVRVAALLLAAPFGLAAVAGAVVAGALFRSWLTYRYLVALTGIDLRALLGACKKSAYLALLCVVAPALAAWSLQAQPVAPLLALVLAALATFVLWLVGIAVLGHPLLGELDVARRKLAALARTS